jgi:hypothetical protein
MRDQLQCSLQKTVNSRENGNKTSTSTSYPPRSNMTTKDAKTSQDLFSPYKNDDDRTSKNELFYRSHVSGFSGIKEKYQTREGLNML